MKLILIFIILFCEVQILLTQIIFNNNQNSVSILIPNSSSKQKINNINWDSFTTIKRKNNCGRLTQELWKLIKWYIGNSKTIKITEIRKMKSQEILEFTEDFIEEAHKEIGLPIVFKQVDFSFEEPHVTYAETFSWRGGQFPKRSSFQMPVSNRSKREINLNPTDKSSVPRRDEPDFSCFVIVKSMQILNEYLIGNPRFPFYKTEGNYIILQTDPIEEEWKLTAESVMEKLWKDYGVLDVIIVSPCIDISEKTQTIGYYDPFFKTNDTNWGSLKWIPIEDLYSNNGWLLNKCVNFNGKPMKFSIFRRYPTLLPIKELPSVFIDSYIGAVTKYSQGYGGYDGLILGNIAKLLNFKVEIVFPSDKIEYGYPLKNGTFTGTIGDILYRRSEISINGRFIKDYFTDEIDFLFPVYCDKFCIVSPKAMKIPQSLAIFLCFDPFVWMTFVIFNIICGYFWFLLKKWAAKKQTMNVLNRKAHETHSPANDKFSVISLEMWVIMLAGPSALLPFRTTERLFMTACLLANLIIAGTFQGTLTTSFSTTSFYKDINTLEELDQSGLHIGTSSKAISDIFGVNSTDLMKSLESKFHILVNQSAMKRTAYKRDMCCVERSADVNLIMQNMFQLPDGTPMIHVIKQCPRVYYLSYIVKKGWPYTTKFSMILRRFAEAGLLDKWYYDTEQAIIQNQRLKKQIIEESTHSFNLIDMQTSFYILGIGLLICGIVFLLEIFMERPSKRKNNKELYRINIGN